MRAAENLGRFNADATTAWRAVVGDCEDPGVLERSTDGGETWVELPLDLAPVSRVRVLSTQTLFAIGGAADCEPTYLSSSTAGASWASNDQFLDGSWFIVPGDRIRMATPAGEVEVPCAPVDLAALDAQNAAVLCSNGSLMLTDDGGASWSATEPQMDASALGVAEDGYVLAGAHDGCDDDIALTLTDLAGESRDNLTCADGVNSEAVTVSAGGDVVWLWSGEDVRVLAGVGSA